MKERATGGNPRAINPHVRVEEESVSAAAPSHRHSFCKRIKRALALMVGIWCGSLCADISLSPSSQTVSADGGSYQFVITYTGGMSYRTPSASASWIHVGGLISSSTFTQFYSVDANPSSSTRTGTIYGTFNGIDYTFKITQPGRQVYTVTFYGGGKTLGTATMEKGKNTNQAAASLYHPTRAGYELTGWADASGNIMFDAQGRAANGNYWNGSYVKGSSSATWKYAGNVTAYAQWKKAASQKYTVTFYGGGKTLGTATMETGKNTNQAAASLYKPTRAGYVLIGWADANGNILFDAQGFAVNGNYWNGSYVKGSSSATWKHMGNVTVYAYWALAKYTVTFYGGGRTLGTASVELGKNTNQAVASLYHPTREGYVLTGWYDASGNILFDAQGRAANGNYWSGSYVKGSSSATWKYSGNVTAYAYWDVSPLSLSPSSQTVSADGGSYQFVITFTGGLSYRTPSVSASWINMTGSQIRVTGGGAGGTITISYSVDANPSSSQRTGSFYGKVNGIDYTFTITQSGQRTTNSNTGASRVASRSADFDLFVPGELAGTFADGTGTFALTLDEGLETAYLVTWAEAGGVTCECEVTVADDTLVLTTEAGEVYRLVWDGGSLVATRAE